MISHLFFKKMFFLKKSLAAEYVIAVDACYIAVRCCRSCHLNLSIAVVARRTAVFCCRTCQCILSTTVQQESLVCICRQLGEVAGFKGNEKDYYDPDNSCINMVLERQTGIPITLGVLYMAVAQRLGLKMHGLQLPGHFMVGDSVEGTTNLIVDPFIGKPSG